MCDNVLHCVWQCIGNRGMCLCPGLGLPQPLESPIWIFASNSNATEFYHGSDVFQSRRLSRCKCSFKLLDEPTGIFDSEVVCPPVPGLDPICLALAQITVLPCPQRVICGHPHHLVSRLLLHSLYSAIPCRRYSLGRGRICNPCIAVYYVEVEKELGFVGVGAPMSGWPH